MADVLDLIDRLRDMAGRAAEPLRAQIAEAQSALDRLDAFAQDCEDVSQLAAASNLFPTYSASAPDRAFPIERDKPAPESGGQHG